MHDIEAQAKELQSKLDQVLGNLKIDNLENELQSLLTERDRPSFWDVPTHAQEVEKQISKLETRIEPWRQIQTKMNTIKKTLELDDASDIESEISKELKDLVELIEARKADLRFAGSYDDHDAIVSLYAGAGGTDAQDWTQMLLRMYTRWADKNRLKVKTIDESPGEEAGLKSVTIEIDGDFVYGKLKGEHGVHRLVRLSPFNADNLRQTSFAKVEVLPKIERPGELELDDKELKIDVYRSGGRGGQSVNTTDSAVRVTHLPTGISVAIQNERSQLQNKETALTILRSKLAQLQLEQHKEKLGELKGPNQSAEWGNQIRSYVLHPYKQVKDLRTKYETSDVNGVLDGDLDGLISACLEQSSEE